MRLAVIGLPQSVHVQKWLYGLQRVGADVTLFSPFATKVSGIPCVQVQGPRWQEPLNLGYLWYHLNGRALREALDAHRIDVAHAIDITPWSVWAWRSGFQPLVSTAMGSDVLPWLSDPPAEVQLRNAANPEGSGSWRQQMAFAVRKRVFRFGVQHALAASVLVTGDNQVLVDGVCDGFGVPRDRVRLNRWGLEPHLFEVSSQLLAATQRALDIAPHQRLVLSPRGATALYQGDRILEGFAHALAEGLTSHVFVFCTFGQHIPRQVQRLADELTTQYANFRLVDRPVPREEMGVLWSLTDIFVSAPVYDGFSSAVNEGRYVGAVPIINQIPATDELFVHHENAWVVDPFTPENLADALVSLVADLPEWKHCFAQKNQPWVKANGILDTNLVRFLDWCAELVAQERVV